jgi:uncharacterized protein YndB with AHSA1/START domain
MTTEKSKTSAASTGPSLVISRVFDAPRHLVFEAWTRKEHLDQWCAPHGFTIPSSSGDLRVGGEFRSLLIAPNGEKYPLRGVYREIVQDELLVFTHIWEEDDGTPEHETLVTVRFADENGKTRMTFEQTNFKSAESREGHEGGWGQCFEKLEQHLTKRKTRS